MTREAERQFLADLCSVPTAPFAEDRVVAFVERFAAKRKKLRVRRDAFGNRLVELPGRRRGARVVFVAHADHPGFLAGATAADGTLHATFHGGVKPSYLPGAKVLFFDGRRVIRGTVLTCEPDDRGRASASTLQVASPVRPGTPGMFDLGEARTRGQRMHARVCDDLAGVASALVAIDRLHRHPPTSPVALLLTRAEEQGFIGAIASVEHPTLLRRDDLLISLECSAEQPYAPQGRGVIVRVGDRTSVFDSSLTAFLVEQAETLAKADATFRHQRSLMPGGTCEATVFDAWGYTAAALCVPLGNYHNMNAERETLAAEHIHLGDWSHLVQLLEQVGRQAHAFEPGMRPLRRLLTRRFARFRPLLDHPAASPNA
jgi:endoglucanase